MFFGASGVEFGVKLESLRYMVLGWRGGGQKSGHWWI